MQTRPAFRWVAVVAVVLGGGCAADDTAISPDVPNGQNHAPTLTAIPDTTVILGDTLRVHLVASDPDGDRLTYKMTVLLHDASEVNYVADAHIDSVNGDFWFVAGGRDRPSRSFLFTVVDKHGYPALAQLDVTVTYYVDQFSTAASLWSSVPFYSPMGQEFTPVYSALDVVELYLRGESAGPGAFLVRIRDGTITGPVMAASDTLMLAGNFSGVALFPFERVTLTPQHLYVLEIVDITGGNCLAGNSGGPASVYPGGRYISKGQPNDRSDMWFKEGAISPPPPEVPPGAVVSARGP